MLLQDILQLPKRIKKQSTRAQPAKVPSWHITSPESLKFIEDANKRQKEKQKKEQHMDQIKKEAVKEARAAERAAKKK